MSGKENDGGHERRAIYSKCCTEAYNRYEFHPDACINCQSLCEYGRKALALNGISMSTHGESQAKQEWLTADRKVRKIIRSMNRRRV